MFTAPSAAQTSMRPCVIEYTLTLRIPASRPVAFYLARKLRALTGLLHTWTARARQRRTLARLDFRLLQDVGITPADRAIEVGKPFWQA